MKNVTLAVILLLGLSGIGFIGAQNLQMQTYDRISDAFNIGFLAMAPKIMCANSIESVFITLTNFTRAIEVKVRILDGPEPDDILAETPIRLVGTPCACLEVRIPPIRSGRRVVTLQLLARRLDLGCDDWEVAVVKKIFIDSCAAETFIETDQPVYLAGQTVKFRVLTLQTDLRPDTTPVTRITILDPHGIPMEEWRNVLGTYGLIEREFPLSKEPPLGHWTIKVIHHGITHQLPFQVEKYETPRFSLLIDKPSYLVIDTTTMNLKICARYPLGQAVPGSIEVKVGVKNIGRVKPGAMKRPILTFKEQDTGSSGCYEAIVDLEHLELCSKQYALADDARLRMTVIYTDADTGVTIKEVDTDTRISKVPFTIQFDSSSVFKPGLPYHGRIILRNPDDSPTDRMQIKLTVHGDTYGVYEDLHYPNEDGVIHFYLPEIMYEIKTLALKASSTYKPASVCGDSSDADNFIIIKPPEAKITVNPQFSPSGSFIEIVPITERVKINSLQTLTIYFVSQVPDILGINFHLMFMSRGKILRSTEVFIWPEDYDAYKHPGAYLPIPMPEHEPHTEKLADPHIGPIDTPVSLVEQGKPKVTHRKFKITAAMSPVTSVIVYYVRKDAEVVSAMVDFDVEEFFENEVKMNFQKPEETPRSLTKLRIQSAPGSLCAYGVVDRAIHMMGEQNRITRKKVFNALAKLQLSAEGGFAELTHRCGDIYQLPVLGKKICAKRRWSAIPRGKIEVPGFEREQLDGAIAFLNMGIVYMSNLKIETRECPKFSVRELYRDENGKNKPVEMDEGSAVDTLVADTPRTLKIKSLFPNTWLWEIKTTEKYGEADVNVVVPDRVTTWMGRGFCTNPVYGAGVSELFALKVSQPFQLELELPPSVIRGERVPVTVVVTDYLQECMVIKLTLKKSDDYTASELKPEETVCVCNGMKATVIFYIIPNVVGQPPVEVIGVAMEDNIDDSICGDDPVDMVQVGRTDSVKKPLRVETRGIAVEEVYSSQFCPEDYSDGIYEERVLLRELPPNIVPGSAEAEVIITGDMLTPSLVNLDLLLRLPLVSGEQNLLDFAPNVYILRYLRSTDQLTQKLREQAVANMYIGYQRQETFRRKNGAYNVFHSDLEGSSWLTAFVVRVFSFAADFMSVDIGDLRASVNWLKSLQDQKTGCFRPTGRIIHRAMRGHVRDEVALTAYIVAAMLEAGIPKTDPTIKKSWECLDIALNGMGDGYTAALMAYTFALADQKCLDKAVKILNDQAIEEYNTIHWETGHQDVPYEKPYLHLKAPAQDIEMTSYVLLSYSIYREDSYVILSGSRIARWIINQMNSIGGFASTQDTMVALQALSEYARVSRIVRGRTSINVNVHFGCEKEPHGLKVREDNRFELQSLPVPLIPEQVVIDATGYACAMSQVIVKYNIIPEEPRNPKFIMSYEAKQVGDDCGVQRIKICATYAGKQRASNLAVISLKLISGYTPDDDSVDNLRKRGIDNGLKRVDVDGKNIDIFVEKFTRKQKCFPLLVRRQFDVKQAKSGVITVYDYYEPSRRVSTFFKFGCDHEADHDENDPRPGLCPKMENTKGCIQDIQLCTDDESCPGSHKCCNNGCGGQMCMIPMGVEKPAAEPKFGSCPLVEPSPKRRICMNECESDDDCNGIEKCCKGQKGCSACSQPSEMNHCPTCLSQLPDVTASTLCKYDYVCSGKLLPNGEIQIKRDLKTNKKLKNIPKVKRLIQDDCSCPILKTKSLVLLMFNNNDLDLEARTLTLRGNSNILKLTAELKTQINDLHVLCDTAPSGNK